MAASSEHLCAGYGRESHEAESRNVGHGIYLCDDCYEERQIDYSVPGRWHRDDDGPTPPLGDPGVAGRTDAA